MATDDKPQRKRVAKRPPTTTSTPPTDAAAEPTQGSAAFLEWVREELFVETTRTAGPIPGADELERYKIVDPNAPRIIFTEFQRESAHRREVEWEIVRGENRRADRGQLFALFVLVLGLSLGCFLVYTGHDAAGTIIAGADLVAGAALFVRERRRADDADGGSTSA